MKKFKKKTAIIVGAISAGLLGLFGIKWYNLTRDTVSADYGIMAPIQIFNSKFMKYEGTYVKGTTVKALINEINNENMDLSDFPFIKYTSPEVIDSRLLYTVTLHYNTHDYIDEITITENNK